MKTRSFLLGLVALVVCSGAYAGEIFGKVFMNGAPVGEGTVALEVQCGAEESATAKTDKTGSYHLVAPGTGKCTLVVDHGDQTANLQIASYDEAVQVDLVLEVKDGKLSVRRK